MAGLPSTARVVIIGGGAVGASSLYHLAKAGWTDCVLLEKNELTSGSTWHAAGNVPTFSSSWSLMNMQRYSTELYRGLAEAVDFTLRAGLEPAHVFDVIGKGAAQSWQMDNRAATMAAGEFDFGFAVEWMRKDLAICLAEADRLGVRLPLTALVDQFYKQVVERGGLRWDTSSLVHLLQHPWSCIRKR